MQLKAAGEVTVGEWLVVAGDNSGTGGSGSGSGSGRDSGRTCVDRITAIDQVTSNLGAMTVVTEAEFIVVNGIIASPFGGVNHDLAHAFYNLHRLAYRAYRSWGEIFPRLYLGGSFGSFGSFEGDAEEFMKGSMEWHENEERRGSRKGSGGRPGSLGGWLSMVQGGLERVWSIVVAL